MISSSRRSFITGLASLLAAPAIVHAVNLMPVKTVEWTVVPDGGFIFIEQPGLTIEHITRIVELMKRNHMVTDPEVRIVHRGLIPVLFINGVARVPAGCTFDHIEVPVTPR
jgi:hypothetical protein